MVHCRSSERVSRAGSETHMIPRGARRTTVSLGALVVLLLVVMGVTVVGTTVAQEEVTVEVDASLSHAPGEETTVTLELVSDNGTVLDQTTATVGANATDASSATLAAEFGGDLEEGDGVTVTAEATSGNTNYEFDSSQVTTNVQEGEEYVVESELDAEPLTVMSDAELAAAPGEETTVQFRLVVRNDDERWAYTIDDTSVTVGPEETNTGEVTLVGDFENEHLNSSHDVTSAGDKLAIVATTVEGNTNYEGYTIWGGHHLRPGVENDQRGEARLAADPVTVNASATLSHEPVDETTMTFELVDADSGDVIDTATDDVSTDASETGEVALTGDFENESLSGGDTLAVVANGTNYNEGAVEVAEAVQPGDTLDVADQLVLDAHREAEFEHTNIEVESQDTDGVVSVSVDIENVGDGPGYYDLSIDVDGERMFDDARQSLEPGESVTDSVELVLPESGEYEIGVAEMDNYPQNQTLSVTGLPQGIEITEYELSETSLLVDETLAIEVTVENAGNEAETIDVPLLVDGTVAETETVAIEANATETVTFERSVDEPGRFDATVGALDRTSVVVSTEPSFDDYTNGERVDVAGLQDATGDWNAGSIDADMFRDVIDVWSTQNSSYTVPNGAAVPV